ncbi:MAG: hypothetical protein M3P51_05500 [Chloroflexota bacterium]|nr:hypothetical protein [Chloroflexota bacterium]
MKGRTIHPTPRHLEDPLKLLGLTPGQWAAAFIGMVLAAAAFNYLPVIIPIKVRGFICVLLFGTPVLAATAASYAGVGVGRFSTHIWTYWTTPRVYLPDQPRTNGPTRIHLFDGSPRVDEYEDL